ncbi:hypothetical protein M9H77_22774 [Catharanthus roseus]|uniref:Uncharacterized protein n=1 Tax=Catharanthus roseus TaxID=4058 RepID=A0ACC0AVG2_CATRO|nr:hypothetical protein M9H77_22774 [Catharanthus roseus]
MTIAAVAAIDCPKANEKEKGALKAKLEVITKKKKGKGLIGVWNQDSSESEGEEKENMCFMALESKVQSSPFNFSSSINNNDDDDNELKKISKRIKDLKNKLMIY